MKRLSFYAFLVILSALPFSMPVLGGPLSNLLAPSANSNAVAASASANTPTVADTSGSSGESVSFLEQTSAEDASKLYQALVQQYVRDTKVFSNLLEEKKYIQCLSLVVHWISITASTVGEGLASYMGTSRVTILEGLRVIYDEVAPLAKNEMQEIASNPTDVSSQEPQSSEALVAKFKREAEIYAKLYQDQKYIDCLDLVVSWINTISTPAGAVTATQLGTTQSQSLLGFVDIYTEIEPLAIEQMNQIASKTTDEETGSGIRYFGYYYMNHSCEPPYSELEYDSLEEIRSLGNCNVVLNCDNPLHQNDVFCNNLDKAKSNGIKVFVGTSIFLAPKEGSERTLILSPDWKTYSNSIQSTIDKYPGTIMGWHFDEPYWWNISKEDFHTLTKHLRTKNPTLRILAVEPPDALQKSGFPEDYYAYCTDLGVDYYPMNTTNIANYKKMLDLLAGKANNNQYLWGIFHGVSNDTTYLKKALEGYLALESQYPRLIGLIGWWYHDFSGTPGLRTQFAKDSSLKEYHVTEGKKILAK